MNNEWWDPMFQKADVSTYKTPSGKVLHLTLLLFSYYPCPQINTAKLSKLRKNELVELSAKVQHKGSKLTELITTLQDNEARLQDLVKTLQKEKANLDEQIMIILGEKQLLG